MVFLKKTITIVSLLLIALTLYLIINIAYHSFNKYLSVNKPIKANILLVEGWMSDQALQRVSELYKTDKYERIITTGLEAPEYYKMSMNGSLTFYINDYQIPDLKKRKHKIEINAYGETTGKNRAHVNAYFNDSLIGDFYISKRKRIYSIYWNENLAGIDSVAIQFDNDGIGSFGDRNINIKEICIDNKITISYMNNSVYNVNTTDRKEKRVNNYNSYAEIARHTLLSFGIDSNKIIAISGNSSSIHRTIASATSVKEYLKLSGIKSGKINIVSIGPHARRTLLTYSTILNKTCFELGIISLDIYQIGFSKFRKSLNTLSEAFEIFYYKLILLGYK